MRNSQEVYSLMSLEKWGRFSQLQEHFLLYRRVLCLREGFSGRVYIMSPSLAHQGHTNGNIFYLNKPH